jgi:DNA mismatch repair protein MutL
MTALRRLPETLVNRIAAGEVVERPASAVKELVENAIDAGARRIDVVARDGGRTLISVTDDGSGMTAEELSLAVERHATSKLPDDDLTAILTMGFRGEALPSIGAVGRLAITSRTEGADSAWRIEVEGGTVSGPQPAAHPPGTRVELRDLFYATPARLKFLRGERSEANQIADVLNRLAMARPDIGFSLSDGAREKFRYPAEGGDLFDARLSRLARIMGRDFAENALALDAEREGARLTGYAGLPTLNRGNAQRQYLFVNGRPVRDRLLVGAVRGAYADFLARDGRPVPRAGCARGRRQRAPGQGRGAVPRFRHDPRADRRGATPCPGGGRASRLDHGRGGGARRGTSRHGAFRRISIRVRRAPAAARAGRTGGSVPGAVRPPAAVGPAGRRFRGRGAGNSRTARGLSPGRRPGPAARYLRCRADGRRPRHRRPARGA